MMGKCLIPAALLAAATVAFCPAHAEGPQAADIAAQAPASASLLRTGAASFCVARGGIEVAPLSYDVEGGPDAWVRIQRDRGEVVSAEVIRAEDAGLIESIECLDARLAPMS